jgi:hypothetical protein
MNRVILGVQATGVAALLVGVAACGSASSALAHQSTTDNLLGASSVSGQNLAAADAAFANFESGGDRVMCLDADSNHYPNDGDSIQLWGCNTHAEQEWRITSAGQLQNVNTSMCLDADSNHYPNDGDSIQLWGCNTHAEQEWLQGSVASAIASTAFGQRGVADNPVGTYCNKYSSYWADGSTKCSSGLRSEEWCADFAAWAWRQAGFSFTSGSATGDINGSAGSFYHWAVAHNTWHKAGNGYTPQPGDVAVYGSSGANTSHVGVVYSNGSSGPNVVNGDWETNFPDEFPTSVYYQANESSESGTKLVGYASP